MVKVREIDVQKQACLPLSKCMQLVMSGIAHRLLRSTLTMAVILLAVAFFMAMLSEAMFLRSTTDLVQDEIAQAREATRLLSRFYDKPGTLALSIILAQANDDPACLEEYSVVTGFERKQLVALSSRAHWEQVYLRFFKEMSSGKRNILVKKNIGRAVFPFLAEKSAWQAFVQNMEPLRSLKLPGGFDRFRVFLKEYKSYLAELDLFEKKWKDTLDRLAVASGALIGEEAPETWLCHASPTDLVAWRAMVNGVGFRLDATTLDRIILLLKAARLRDDVIATLNLPAKKQEWKKTFQQRMTLDEKLTFLTDARVVSLLDNRFTTEQLADVSEEFSKERTLNRLEKELAGKTETASGSVLSGRQVFLLFISLVVCMVGIANAMLMAITERFREIATMKCLGATDGYILTQFMLEAMMQGLAGGVLGMLSGFLLSLLKNGIQFGWHLFSAFPVLEIGVCGVASLLTGVFLAGVASLYPSWAASRMAPMEAMRVE